MILCFSLIVKRKVGPQSSAFCERNPCAQEKRDIGKKHSPGFWPRLAGIIDMSNKTYFSKVILFAAWKSPVLIL
jgi:hypothetical protein